ncbi:uncharacterized protein [Amphiura filiformis]|uniref:uncharacterized protein n=1 Tax=Amphiura filiformis TaxID=82378 RepID=UPI003B20C195
MTGFAGAGHCSVCCTVGQGNYKAPFDGEGGLEPLVPILECVSPQQNDTGYIAWFGYTNNNPHNIYLPIGPDNRFEIMSEIVSSSVAVEDMGQPTKFGPGKHDNVFSIRLSTETDAVMWYLAYSLSNMRYEIMASAEFGIPCTGDEIPEEERRQANETDPGFCECFHGYWGSCCENECIGGGDNPCYGNGICDPVYGNCTCRVGLEDTPDCKTCDEGWTGVDCSVALTGTPNQAEGFHYGMAYGQGHFTTFDGSMYTYYGIGEHILFIAENIDAEIRLVPCYSDSYSTCVNAFGIRFNDATIVTIHGGYTDDELQGYVWINAVESPIGDTQHLDGNYYITRIAYDHYQIYASDVLYVDVYVRGRYLDIHVRGIPLTCSKFHGLLGSCDGKQWNDLITRDGDIVGIGENATIELSQISLHEVFGPSWIVNTYPSLFIYNYGQYAEVQDITNSGAGYALFFKDTGAKSGVLNTFSDSDLTIEFLLQIHPDMNECGVILSYTLQNTLAFIQCNNNLRMSYGAQEFSTAFNLEANIWYHTALVWQKSTQLLQLYCITPSGDSLTHIFNFGVSNIVAPGGVLTMGQWNPPIGFEGSLPYRGFTGWIDDLKIWKRYFQRSELMNRIGFYTYPTAPDLASYWPLNEGQGAVLHDAISLGTLFMPVEPWRTPLWLYSSATLQYSAVIDTKIIYKVSFTSTDFEDEADTFCFDTISSTDFDYYCLDLSLAAYYTLTCQRDAANSNNLAQTMEVLLAYSDHCQHVEETLTWPAQSFCHSYQDRQFPYWIGSYCEIPCISGYTEEDKELCMCYPGFFGSDCNDQCDGGAATPCSNHGYCLEADGSCNCPVYYTGYDCSVCDEGWMGPDCSTAEVSLEPETPFDVCSMFSYGHYLMFDGIAYNMDAQGEFVLSKSDDASVYVHQVPCGDNTVCTNALWIQLPTNNLTFTVSNDADIEHMLWLDGEEMIVKEDFQFASGHILTRTSLTTYELQHLDISNITVAVQDYFIDVQVVLTRSNCLSMDGALCGNCNGNIDDNFQLANDVFIPANDVTYEIINGLFADSCKIPPEETTHFIYEVQLPASYSLYFDSVGCISDPLTYSFDLTTDVTIEFLFKADNPYLFGGTLLSYLNIHTFAITNDVTLKIHYNTDVIDTKIVTQTENWGFISFMYVRATGNSTLYYISEDGTLQGFSYVLSKGLFEPGGTLALGRWQPGRNPGQEDPPATEYRGIIDEVRIWKKTFDILVMWQSYQMDVQQDAPYLGGLWKMSTGRGHVVIELIHQHNIYLPEVVGPSWQLSNAPIKQKQTVEFDYITRIVTKFTSDLPIPEAEEQCDSLILKDGIAQQCTSLGLPLPQFLYHSCLLDVASDSDLQSSLVSLNAFSAYCGAALDLAVPPLITLCNNITDSDRLRELGCLKGLCVYGTYDLETEICTCDLGYWGGTCAEICPGGIEEPCNNHGVCIQETGYCKCDLTWVDESNCTKCEPGWSGDDCLVSEPEEDVNKTKPVCNMFGQGHYSIFDGVRFDFKEVGEYYLVQNADFEVQVRVLPCYDQSSCVTAVAVRNQGHSVLMRAGYTTESQLLLWEDGLQVFYDGTSYSMQHLMFRHIASLEYEVTSINLDNITLHVRITDRALNVDVQQLSTICDDSYGICGSCDGNSTNDITDKDYAVENSLWRVPEEESLFTPLFEQNSYSEEYGLTGAEYCLHLKDSYLSSNVLEDAFDNYDDATIEFFLKAEGSDGVILSYSTMTSFSIYLDGTIRIEIGGERFDTELIAEINVWNQITIVWKRRVTYLEIFLTKSDGTILQRSMQLNPATTIFVPGGYLAIGRWQPPSNGNAAPPTSNSFIGDIEELRIWKKALTAFDIETKYGRNYQPSDSDLSGLWKFNEGQGDVIYDLIGGANLYFVLQTWTINVPTWRFSYANIALLDVTYTYIFLDIIWEEQVTKLCTSVILSSTMTSHCSLEEAAFDFYLIGCIRDYGLSRTLHSALSATVALSDFCSLTFKLPAESWPAKDACNAFHGIQFPIWTGEDCTVQCFFTNQLTQDTSCLCSQGYWGDSCTEVCPGGSLSPCSQHGSCLQDTGICECHSNYYGDSLCSICTAGWLGDDCSLPVTNLNPVAPTRHCSVSSGGFFTAFDTSSTVFTDPGDLIFYENKEAELAIQIRQAPCEHHEACITAVAINVHSTVVIVQAPAIQAGEPLILLNGEQILLGLNITIEGDFLLARMDATRYDITGPNGFLLVLHTTEVYINIDFAISQTFCAQSLGISGPCIPTEVDCNDDPFCLIQHQGLAVYAEYYSLTYSLIQQYCKQSLLPLSQSLIYLAYSTNSYPGFPLVSYPTAAGFGLFFNNSGIISGPFADDVFTSDYVTLQMYVKYEDSPSGTLLSFTKESTFAVYAFDGRFHLQFRHDRINTGILIPSGEWLQISIVYNPLSGRLDFYCINSIGVLFHHYHNIGIGVFPVGGALGLGIWQLPYDSSFPPDGVFAGYIDGVIVWNRPFSPADILIGWKGSVSRYDTSVKSFWSFDSGSSTTAIDLVLENNFIFPLDVNLQPKWWQSDAPITSVTASIFTTVVSFPSKELEQLANEKCHSLFYSGVLHAQCGALTVGVQFHYMTCLRNIADTGYVTDSMDSAVSFASECQVTLALIVWPGKYLCNEFEDHIFPVYGGEDCEQECYFGAFKDNICICKFGYWGVTCNNICPGGGPLQPCNRHGTCDPVTGTCVCDESWKGDTECGSCTDGWTGSDCSILVPILPDNHVVTCSARSSVYINYESQIFTVNSVGAYSLTKLPGIDIQVNQIFCDIDSICLDGLGVIFPPYNFTIQHDGAYKTVFHIDGQASNLDNTLQLTSNIGDDDKNILTLQKSSSRVYEITDQNLGLYLHVTTMSSHLIVDAEISGNTCDLYAMPGLCGPCTRSPRSGRSGRSGGLVVLDPDDSAEEIAQKVEQARVCESLFYTDTEGTCAPAVFYAGTAVVLHNSAAVVESPEGFTGPYTTIELLVKTCGTQCGGTILSYSSTKTFYISNAFDTISLHFDNINITTDISLEVDVWSQISLVWDRESTTLDLYVFDSDGSPQRRSFILPDDIFPDGGTLALGRWQPSADGSGFIPPPDNFRGEIDELRIWDSDFDSNAIQSHWNSNTLPGTRGLDGVWKFNEGTGTRAYDGVSGQPMVLTDTSLDAPSWVPSDAPIPAPSLDGDSKESDFVDPDEDSIPGWVDSFCASVILEGPLHSACPIGDAAQQSYYISCVQAVSTSNSTEDGLDAVIEYADYCQIALDLPNWPAQPLCNAFGNAPFPLWIGDNCNIQCAFGSKQPHDRNVCVCDHGYWSITCDKACTGGSQNPCSNVGACDVHTGECHCPINWQGASDCSKCTPGWIGSDCSIAESYTSGIGIHINVQISVIIGVSQITTFNGFTFLHYSVGEYHLLQISKTALIIQAKYVQCYGQDSCIKYVSLRFGDDFNGFAVVTIGGARISGGHFLVNINGRDTVIDARLEFGKSGYIFERLSYLELLISGPSNFHMIVRADGIYLTLDVLLPDDLCPLSSGLLVGGCCTLENRTDSGLNTVLSQQPLDLCYEDLPVQEPSPMVSQSYIFPQDTSQDDVTCDENKLPLSDEAIKEYISSWIVDPCDTFIVYPDSKTKYQTRGSYYLQFEKSLVYTKDVTLFVTGSSYDVTLELFIKCDDVIRNGGVVYSYSHHTSFLLVVQETIKVYIGGVEFTTNLVVEDGKWNKLVIVYQDVAGKLNIYHLNAAGNVKRHEIRVQQNLALFRVAGYFAVGIWQPSWDHPDQIPLPGFMGAIDDIQYLEQTLHIS